MGMVSFTPPSLYLLGGQHNALDVSSLASAGPSVVQSPYGLHCLHCRLVNRLYCH